MGEGRDNLIVGSAIIGNLGHLFMALITTLVMMFLAQFKTLGFYDFTRIIILVFIYILTLFLWFAMGMRSTKNTKENHLIIGGITGLISIMPAAIFTILCHILSIKYKDGGSLTKWNIFHLIGGPTLFWQRPLSFIGEIINGNGYYIFYFNLLLVGLSILAGSIVFKKKDKRI